MDIKVSVVMAVYNSSKYIRQALDSLINQSLTDIEIITVDDGSSDNSLDILHEYGSKDSRVHVYENKEKSDGAALARNLGVMHAIGKYLSVLDADDFFEPDMLEKAYNKAESANADIVLYDGYRYDNLNGVDLERGTILYKDKIVSDEFAPIENKDNLFEMTSGAAWNAMFSIKLVRDNNLKFQSFHHADDLEFVYIGYATAKKIAILPDRLIHYRVNITTSQAANINEWPDTAWQAMLSFKNKLEELGLYDTYKISYMRKALDYQLFYLNHMKTAESFHKLYRELKNQRLKELELDKATIEEIGNEMLIEMRDIILSVEPDEYLFRLMNNMEPFSLTVSWKKKVPVNSKVILYGGDRTAVDVCYTILWNRDYTLVSWVDDQYDVLGYPVESPDVINNADYDYILVASRTEGAFLKVRDKLIASGIDADKIVGLQQ